MKRANTVSAVSDMLSNTLDLVALPFQRRSIYDISPPSRPAPITLFSTAEKDDDKTAGSFMTEGKGMLRIRFLHDPPKCDLCPQENHERDGTCT